MNFKISKKLHDRLCLERYDEYIFGSQLHGIANENSDKDYIRVISDVMYECFNTKGKYLPNIHSYQYDDIENNTQYIWMTETQFYRNLFSGDGNMIADVVILSGDFEDALFLCRTYKIIKGYIGVAKRDLKLHGNNDKKKFHAFRSLMMAEMLIDNKLPTISDVINLKNNTTLPSTKELNDMENELRTKLNKMLNDCEIDLYPKFIENDELLQELVSSNNIKEFRY